MSRAKKTDFNDKEKRVLRALAEKGEMHLSDIADLFLSDARARLKKMGKEADKKSVDVQANSFARNSVRFPIKMGLVYGPQHNEALAKSKKGILDRGTYKLSPKGRQMAQKGKEKTTKAPVKKKEKQPEPVAPQVMETTTKEPALAQVACG